MVHQYAQLSHADFEDLCRDIAKAELGMRFEAFGPGPDGGMDGRHSKNGKATILQAKHYHRSTFNDLKRVMKTESAKIALLKPDRYLLFASQSLNPTKKNALIKVANSTAVSTLDIWGLEDIDGALRRNPEIVKSHVKLWLSSSAVLDKLINAGLEAYTQATRDEIIEKLKVYVRNPSFDEAVKRLEEQQVLIISGAPGVGKTTLAEMIAYHYLNDDWKFTAISNLDDGFSKIDDSEKRVFFFDDFLGRIALNKQSLMQHDNALATFVRRVRRSKNARFILTTRAHIFEEARLISDRVDDNSIQLSKFILDVGSYTRRVKSRIMFNHLYASDLSAKHAEALLAGDWLKEIIDHKNYNPRVVASVSSDLIEVVDAEKYPEYILEALNNPNALWEKPYKNLVMRDQNFLLALFFCSEYGIKIDELKPIFRSVNHAVCKHYGHSANPDDFEDALKSLESGFVSITGQKVGFVNPAVRDFLNYHLTEFELLNLLPECSTRADWAKELWGHACLLLKERPAELSSFASLFSAFSKKIEEQPTMAFTDNGHFRSYSSYDLSYSERVSLLIDWWNKSGENTFLEQIVLISQSKKLQLISWQDGRDLPEIIYEVKHFEEEFEEIGDQVAKKLSEKLANVLDDGMPTDELTSVVEQIDMYLGEYVPENVKQALEVAIEHEFDSTNGPISDMDTEDELLTQLEHVETLAKLVNRDAEKISATINSKIVDIQEEYESAESPSISSPNRTNRYEEFSDVEIVSLFSTLIY